MKIKNKLLRILSLVLIITMLLPSNVYATEDKGNGGGQNSSGSIGTGTDKGNNPFYKYTGWLVYVAKKAPKVEGEKERGKATIVNNKVVFVCSGTSTPSGYDASGLRSRLNPKIIPEIKVNGKYLTNAPWGVPFDDKGNAQGKEIRDMFEDDTKHFSDNPKQSNREYVIKTYLGASVYNQVEKDPNSYYLMLEACSWYTGRDGHGGYYDIAASTYGWATIFKSWDKKPKTGDGRDWCALYRLPRSCYLSGDWPCLPKHPTDFGPSHWGGSGDGISYEKILEDYGYGMLAIKTNLQTTCNETVNVPHQPPHEIKDSYKYTIIKNYVIKNADGTYESVKCTSKTDSFQKIKIEPEEKITGYKLVAWKATTKSYPDSEKDHYPQDLFKKAVDKNGKLSWFDEVPGTEKAKGKAEKDSKGKFVEIVGKDGEIIDMENVDKKGARANTVFLLLIKEADAQTTCNEKLTVPHQPPDESKGTYTIIKNYVDKKGDTYKSKKCTSKTNSSPVIKVEPEEKTTGYKLVAYAATTKSYKDKDSEKEHNPLNLLAAVNDEGELVWENAVKNKLGTNKLFKGSQKNTTELKGGTFNLTKDELKGANTVFLLLIKEDEDIQTTCDEDKPAPHPAPNESTGTYKIVKNYVTKTDDTYTDDGCYSKTNVANKIKIEDEAKTTGYHLEAWKISTNTKSPVTSVDKHSKLVWEENVPATVKKSGTTPTTVDLKAEDSKGKTVYLLLVRDKSKVQTTCDEPIPTPHPAPNESTGTYKIVKNYVTDSNGKYKDDGCFCKTKVTHQIKIEDESSTTGYTLPILNYR